MVVILPEVRPDLVPVQLHLFFVPVTSQACCQVPEGK